MANDGKKVAKSASDGEQRFTLQQLQQVMEALRLVTEQESAERQIWRDVEASSPPTTSAPQPSTSAGNVTRAGGGSGGTAPDPAPPAPPSSPAVRITTGATGHRGAARSMVHTAVGNEERGGGTCDTCGGNCGGAVYHRAVEDIDPGEAAGGIRWYSITRGQAVGVFRDWMTVAPLVTGVPNAVFQRHPTYGAALAAFMRAANNGNVAIIL
ncbi:uncharacterized protein C8Q71DRAFT_863520 [Rhodofomes roseus]|uniref:Ribonuclease H1 N-terminal domain-containing protein n=1 Tax=Rhodofomes roseus TaxID=34475 RepID=A0ABQ8JY43_9APHY|nr:uncharacterized protein C8Q71DRAFT_863501 [Rhodofomes roseus]XP_047772701.1 uncharacterized protein C8Q71DRAFT_863520 [Rhodofomes roseus]KAH9829179.1 hypothetical protein C8Q71DRAFT_863501 [Rhodofomes roseus]KAH9829199.1 hypothetical protein C8Q71DRAFT_863520 [Rhodofomes roseus]